MGEVRLPSSMPNPGTRVQFGQGAILRHFASPTTLFEHEHEHERRTPNAKRQTPCEALRPGTSRTDILLDPRF